MHLFVTGIGTDAGKTLASAVLTEALHADYWKPVQAGLPRDADAVRNLISNEESEIFPEVYQLQAPMSPHAAAAREGTQIELHQIRVPLSHRHAVIEGAGGVLAPLNERDFAIDIAAFMGLEVVLVCHLYLGSINHSIMSINEINNRNLRVKGLIFNGPENLESMQFIQGYCGWDVLLHIPQLDVVDKAAVLKLAAEIKERL
jgi:dethiobiotin synthetase